MRILALRGENLASLADPFEIDLTAEPLFGAGLFAITGETGAGKSTLLDAVCLALYGRFPRIVAEGGNEALPDVAGDLLTARDPRSILRRGAALGHAEVDFVGVDGARYRARWQVARARGKAAGRLQKVSRLLHRLAENGEIATTLADKVTEVDDEVRRLTDLTFEQFRRTVLLAQGDFDAFLRSDDRDRADLLEKITGTEIYARLSARTFERTRDRRDAVEALRLRRAEIGLLSEEDRAERLTRRAEIDARRTDLATLAGGHEAAITRSKTIAEAEARLAEAEAAALTATTDHAGAGDERALLEAIGNAHRLAPLLRAVEAAERAEGTAAAGLAACETELAGATARLEASAPLRHAAQQTLEAIEARIRVLQPEWEKAAELDAHISTAAAEVAGAETLVAEAEAARAFQAERIAGLEKRRGDIAVEFGRLEAEEARVAVFAPLAARWEEISDRLGERLAVRRALDAATMRRAEASRVGADLEARKTAAEARAAERAVRRTALDARLSERAALLAAFDEATVRSRDASLRALAGDIDAARAHLDALARATSDETVASDAAEAARRDLAETMEAHVGVAADLADARARLAESAVAVRLADALASHEAEHLRATLVDGAPCPVCGATDHPILADPTIAEAMAEARRRRAELTVREADLARRLTELDGRRAAAEARLTNAEAARAAAGARIATATAALATARDAAAIAADRLALPLVDAPDWPIRLAETLTDAVAAGARALAEIERLRGEIDRLRRDVDALDREARTAEAEDRREAEALAAARLTEATAATVETNARDRLGEIDARLSPVLADLDLTAADLDHDGEALRSRLGTQVAHLRALAEARARLETEERHLERAILGDRVAREHAERALAGAEATRAARASTLDRLRLERAGLLEGTPTAAHRDAVTAERDAARVALDAAVAALDSARSTQTTALTQRDERHHALARARADTAERLHERDRALAAADLDLATVTAHLARPEASVEALAARITALDRRLTETAVAVTARRADLDTALAAGRPDASIADLEQALAAIAAEIRALDEAVGALANELAADDRARARAGGLEAEIAEAERVAKIWIAVDEAIGSRDGAKFRTFAQGITLDRLTGLANRHLATLSPRYRLARTEGLGLAIVDRDMGEEMRSTRSLSGGERFLASLALALALSGLEGRRSFVDTLFIDEGFGSLDAATLDVAIDALESLQSEGRKVGVISHVAALHERIPVQIRVRRAGLGRSRVEIDSGRG